MMKKTLALILALLMCVSVISVFAEEEILEEEHVVEVIEEAIDSDGVYEFSVNKINDICIDETGDRLEYITIDLSGISTSAGKLLYDYDGSKPADVAETTKYYRDKSGTSIKLIEKIAFVPKLSYSGEVEIGYTAYAERSSTRDPYETFEGKIVLTVTESINAGDIDLIKIDVKAGGKYKFSIDDFKREFNNAGVTMNYMKFTLPEVENGKLYYNYSATSTSSSYNKAVTATNAYYLEPKTTSSLSFEKVTLVVADEVAGDFDLEYKVYDRDDEAHDGVITFCIEEADSYDTTYKSEGDSVFLRASDFNTECIEKTGSRLRSVKFQKPSSGALWYDYDNEEDSKAQMSTSKSYYYNSEPYLYLMAFVPKADYSGTVSIDYEGTSISNEKYNGTITIKVSSADLEEVKDISYSIKDNATKTFSASTIASLCKTLTGETLDYVKFTAPTKGKLYYKYNKTGEFAVTSSDRFYNKSADGDYINYVTYVPAKNYSGTVTVSYIGTTVDDTRFKGEIKIKVTASETKDEDDDEVKDIKYSGNVGKAIKFDAEDFYDICDSYAEDDLEYVVFAVPSSTVGTMYYDFDGDDEAKIKSSTKVYYEDDDPILSKISFVPEKAGTIRIKYTAYPYYEDDYTGYVQLTVKDGSSTGTTGASGMKNFKKSNTYKNGLFKDIDEDEWYGANKTGAIKSAYAYGLIKGRTDGTFDPQGNMTVAEAITIAARIGDIYYNDKTKFGEGDKNWYDDYVNYAIEYKIIRKNDFTNYNAKITRAQMAYIFANILPEEAMEEINYIDEIKDVSEDDKYFEEILLLYRVGIVLGDEKGAFNPNKNITRAEVSAIVSRIVDLDERLED